MVVVVEWSNTILTSLQKKKEACFVLVNLFIKYKFTKKQKQLL